MPFPDPDFSKWLSNIRRDFHMHPELSFKEHRTTRTIAEILEALHLPVTLFPDLTGAVALIQGARGGPTVGLRADMDALPIQEENDVPYRSRNDGVMHACGHDGHMAIMVGVAKRIREEGLASEFAGNVKCLFQPAEERAAGAMAMIERGVLENPPVDLLLAGHVTSDLRAGEVGLFKGVGFASADRFEIRITGKGAHGARPEEGIDPVVAGAHLVGALQSVVSRNIKPMEAGVITVGKFRAGEAANVIPERAILEGTLRALSEPVRKHLIQRVKEMAAGTETLFQVTCDLKFHGGTPVLSNDARLVGLLYEAAGRIVGKEKIHWIPPAMGAEDFAFFAKQRPAALIRLGCAKDKGKSPFGLHSPRFDMDESVLEIGCAVFFEALRMILVERRLKDALVL